MVVNREEHDSGYLRLLSQDQTRTLHVQQWTQRRLAKAFCSSRGRLTFAELFVDMRIPYTCTMRE